MINPYDANAELGARLLEILIKVRPHVSNEEMHDLCYAIGVQIPVAPRETSAQQILRKHREAQQAELRG